MEKNIDGIENKQKEISEEVLNNVAGIKEKNTILEGKQKNRNFKIIFSFLIIFILIGLVLCYIGLQGYPKNIINSKFELIEGQDYKINENSDLSLKYIEMNNENGFLLCYDNENLEIDTQDEEMKLVKSIKVGKSCISITGSFFNVNNRVTKNIEKDILQSFYERMSIEDVVKIEEYLDIDTPYIVSKNEKCYFIDYVCPLNDNTRYVIYYRIIIQDVENLNIELTENEKDTLKDFLPELLKVMNIADFR